MEAFILRGASDSDGERRNCGEHITCTLIYSSITNILYHSTFIENPIKCYLHLINQIQQNLGITYSYVYPKL